MTKYVRINRTEFEAWLSTQGTWGLKAGCGGVYLLHLNDKVAVEINSTTGHQDRVMGKGRASITMRLVSRLTGQTLNQKAVGQSHFKRTTNWRANLEHGIARLEEAYLKSMSWYNRIAEIPDREAYRTETLRSIERIPSWDTDRLLSIFHARVCNGDVLTPKQEAVISSRTNAPCRESDVEHLRELYRRARKHQDNWTMDFVTSVAQRIKSGQSLSSKQRGILGKKLNAYKMSSLPGARA